MLKRKRMQASKRTTMVSLIENRNIEKENIPQALREVGVIPAPKAWYHFIDQLLLWFAGLALAFSMMFFIAFNWTAFGRFGKFALVEGSILLTVLLYGYVSEKSLLSKVLLMVSSLLLGVLLALVGQTYQTGADPWQLFFYWAILILPWVVASRFSALWMFWIFLINISLLLYVEAFRGFFGFVFHSEVSFLWIFFAFNTLAWALWEFFSSRVSWLDDTWAIRLLGFVSMSAITSLALSFIWEESSGLTLLVWVAWLIAVYMLYRVRKIDLFMLALAALTFSIVLINFLIHLFSWRDFNLGYILFIGLVILGLGGGFAMWLKSLQKEAENETE
jgi:uncharacterized membrane protein